MKAQPLLVTLTTVLISLLVSCIGTDHGGIVSYEYVLRNESGVPVLIEVYQASSPEISPSVIVLQDAEELIKHHNDKPPYSGFSYFTFFEGDSLRIVFNDEKEAVFSCSGIIENCREELNPLNPLYSEHMREEFIITQKHFQEAVKIKD